MNPYRPIQRARVGLGQFSPFINPFEVTGDQAPMTSPSGSSSPAAVAAADAAKPLLVLAGLGGLAFSAATAYVGIKYGTDKGNKDFQRALGWTVGVASALSGVVRLIGVGALLLLPTPTVRPSVMAGNGY